MRPLRGKTIRLELSEGKPPSEFIVWRSGLNATRNGYAVLFDDEAARDVMAAYAEHATEIMIDLEHVSLDDRHPNWNPDAQGWATLEIRDGALWATNVRWTPEGSQRLSEQRQRYTSPTFYSSAVDGDEMRQRPNRIVNIALCAMPATDHLPALVAKETRRMKINSQLLVRVKKTLSMGGAPADIIRKLAEDVGDAEAAPGKSFMELAEFLGVSIDPGTDPIGFIAALKDGVAAMMAGLEAAPPAPPAEESPEAPSEMAAAAKLLCSLTGRGDINGALVEVSDWRQLAIKHREESLKLARELADLEATKRRSLTARLVVCGSETPATAWSDDAKTEPAKHLRALSVAELEARVLNFESKSGRPSTVVAASSSELSARELAFCSEVGADPKVYARNKAIRAQAQGR